MPAASPELETRVQVGRTVCLRKTRPGSGLKQVVMSAPLGTDPEEPVLCLDSQRAVVTHVLYKPTSGDINGDVYR